MKAHGCIKFINLIYYVKKCSFDIAGFQAGKQLDRGIPDFLRLYGIWSRSNSGEHQDQWQEISGISKPIFFFVGKGPKPSFGRWTYWKKFDYFADFWGMFVIGTTGLVLWFPEEATRYFPGWWVNIATIIHSIEALLASLFILLVHFFHTHLRPEALPLDSGIFTQRMPLS